jgi:7-carboxy-7-deazaguanine synthase
MEPRFKIAEQFVSINGEGTRAGELAVFIRLCSCNLCCSYCDTQWANQPDTPYQLQTTAEILQFIRQTGIRNVTLTGGEPLLTPDVATLIAAITADDTLSLEIETNGSVDLQPFAAMEKRPIFTMDYKLPSSGMEAAMRTENFALLQAQDTVKLVAGSKEDLERGAEIIRQFHLTARCHVYFSPVYGAIAPQEMVEFLIQHQLNGVRLQLQLHKYIWEPQARGV